MTLAYKLPDGTDGQSVLNSQLAAQADGRLIVTSDGIVGTTVLLVYETLMQTDVATVSLALTYAVWWWVLLFRTTLPFPRTEADADEFARRLAADG